MTFLKTLTIPVKKPKGKYCVDAKQSRLSCPMGVCLASLCGACFCYGSVSDDASQKQGYRQGGQLKRYVCLDIFIKR